MNIATRAFCVFILLIMLAACGSVPTSTPTAAPTAAPTELPTDVPPTATLEPTQTPVEIGANVFDVRTAQYLMDTAGFHGMDESLNETKTIETSYLSTVNRVKKVVGQTTWPDQLADASQAFITALDELAVALEADKVDEAAAGATTAHETQHNLSHAIDEWAETAETGMAKADPFDIRVVQYFMDTAGFHGMDESLNETKTIETSYLSTVNRVRKIVGQTTWPDELADASQAFITALDELAVALEAEKVDEAAAGATAAHETEHDLSHEIDEWAETAGMGTVTANAFDLRVVQYLMDTAGFHDIAESLDETKTIETSYLSTVNRVRKVVAQTIWPDELEEAAQALVKSLDELATTLEADNLDEAIGVAATVHETEHDFSRDIDQWLGDDVDAH